MKIREFVVRLESPDRENGDRKYKATMRRVGGTEEYSSTSVAPAAAILGAVIKFCDAYFGGRR